MFSTARTLQSCRLPEGGSAADCRRAGVLQTAGGREGCMATPGLGGIPDTGKEQIYRVRCKSPPLQCSAVLALAEQSSTLQGSRRAELYISMIFQSSSLQFETLVEQCSTLQGSSRAVFYIARLSQSSALRCKDLKDPLTARVNSARLSSLVLGSGGVVPILAAHGAITQCIKL